jgi:hypothetical protein
MELERELADVRACSWQAVERLSLAPLPQRISDKYDGFERWHAMIVAAEKAGD